MTFLSAFWDFLNISAPYLLLGCLVGGFLHSFLTVESVKKFLGKGGMLDIAKAAFIGIPLPLCSCGVIPAAVTLRKSGATNGTTSAFLISTPENGVDSLAMTYSMMDLPMTLIRPVAGFFSAFMAGVIQMFFNPFILPQEDNEPKTSCCPSQAKPERSLKDKIFGSLKYGFHDLINDMALWLLVGLVVGAFINFVVPEDFFSSFGDHTSRLLILGIGIPLYICASATTPIAASLVLKGMSPGVALLLLLVGPATNMSNLVILQKYIGKRGVIINIFSIALVALLFSYLTDFIYTSFNLSMDFKVSHHHGDEISLFTQFCSLVLICLIARGIFYEEIKPRLKKNHEGCH
jgi:uncharacterized membrane protein YraQ (UPF0718 family)